MPPNQPAVQPYYGIALDEYLKLNRCPHCSVDNPNLLNQTKFNSSTDSTTNPRIWGVYVCQRCGGVVTAGARFDHPHVSEIYPRPEKIDDILPDKVKAYLQQAIDSTFAPSGSVMLSASAVDAMLKEKGYSKGSLYKRIEDATNAGLLTAEMATWAHQVRLDANDQRHVDENADLPTVADAKQVIEFARTLAEFLFVLPAKVTRGIASSKPDSPAT